MSLTLKQTIYGSLAFVLIGCALGFGLAWKLWGQKTKPTMETLAPAYRLKDDNLVLGRAPNLHPILPVPQGDLPQGSTVVRVIKVVVQGSPKPPQAPATSQPQPLAQIPALPAAQASALPCPPVEVDLTLVKLKDLSYRVIASSPDGHVLPNSVDIPVVPDVPAPVVRLNDLLLNYDPINKVGGLAYVRHWHRVLAGAGVDIVKQTMATGMPTTASVHVTVGWSW